MAREDKNKRSTSDRGSKNQDNRSFTGNNNLQRSDRDKRHRRRADPNEPQTDTDVDRNHNFELRQELKPQDIPIW